MKRIAFLALGLVLALVPATGGLLAQEPERSADWSPEWYVGKILFKSDRDGQEAFFAVNPDGSGLVRVDDPNVGFYYAEARTQDLTSSDGRYRLFVREVGPDLQIWQQDLQTGDISYIVGGSLGADYEPAWAPDSRYVAYVSQSDGNDEIHLYDRLTNTDRRLTQNTWEWDKHPSFSPDGSQIVFYSNRQARFRHIWLMNADGSQPQNLSGWGAYNDWDPVWIKEAPSAPIPSTSPLELDVPLRTEPGCQPELEDYVGKILFKSDAEGLAAIYLLDPDTGEACRVDDPNVGFYYAEALRRDALSPDGRYRLFVREIGSNHQIWLEDTETGDIAYVAGGAAGADYEPAWSPDGLSVAYVSQRDGNDEIHLLDRGSGQDRRLTQNNWEWDKHPSFNADGSQIVFWSNREAGWKHLWVMNADGSGQRSLGRSGNWNDWDPVWVKAEPSPAPELSTLPLPTGEELPAPAPIELEPLPVEWYVGKILFKSDRDGQEAFFAVNPDGSGLVRVDDPNVGFYYAEARTQDLTSSDGRYRLFVREVGPDLQIWQQDLQTGDISYIVGGSLGADYEPAWAPDSRYVAYVSQSDGNDEIHLYDRLTNTDRRLTQNTWEWDKHPSFSPDGSQIVFYSNRQARFRHIWLMNADGSQPQNLSGWGAYNDWDPVWIKEAPTAR